VLRAHLERPLYKGEIGVVRHDRLRKSGELHGLATKLNYLLDDFIDSALTAVKHRADLYSGGFYNGHLWISFLG
jgi:hypothetical protein